MLNIRIINEAMQQLGIGRTELGTACGVSKEAVSNWFSGESIPRPKKLLRLAETLHVDIAQLIAVPNEPVIAYRTVKNRKPTGVALDAAQSVAEHLKELVPFLHKERVFTPPVLETPSLNEEYINEVARQVRAKAGVKPSEPLLRAQLLELLYDFGAILVPVYWSKGKHGHENALSVYLPDEKVSWVVFNLHAQIDDFNYWLAHELGHCYTLHALQGDDGETFAEKFAQELLFPPEAAQIAADDIVSSPPEQALSRANWYAGKYETSVVTVIRQADAILKKNGKKVTGLESPKFWAAWSSTRHETPTVSHALFDSEQLWGQEYVIKAGEFFRTPVFKTIADWQANQGGRSPSFVANALNVDLSQAVELSLALYEGHSSSADSPNSV
ncbi:helix-turn-helix transcriptional regulator [Herbaspirillum huttiense F1]|uniref:XRE family transcriptional regulator n=1 Tax=Herbaspirillum huttiense TaxID=863372 RepID=UPI002886231F|nr:helix-turn-helix transcriptional regulator [Herbaspirillum huttiense]MDT0359337.1 helix-turn-helix transcriptional regulator [Herbaspirillum huttiense F1]